MDMAPYERDIFIAIAHEEALQRENKQLNG